MKTPTRRDEAAPVIAQTIQGVVGELRPPYDAEQIKAIRKALRAAYPWGWLGSWPYRVWCSEIRRQLQIPRRQTIDPRQVALPIFPTGTGREHGVHQLRSSEQQTDLRESGGV